LKYSDIIFMKNRNFMMKKLLFMLCAVTLMTSCEKAISIESENEVMADGNLTVKIFEIEHTPFASLTRAAASNACTRLNFAVYDEEGTRVQQINQTVEKEPFGAASFQLESGNYQLAVVGHCSKSNPTMTKAEKIQFTNSTGYTDTFLYSTDVTIGEEPLDMQVSLQRIVSLCRFVITDDYPENVKQMKFYYTGGSGAFNAKTGLGSVNSKQTVTYDVKDGVKQFDLYTFLHAKDSSISLKVTALGENETVLRERDFDVPMSQNQITWLSGAFFSGSSSSSSGNVQVDVDTNWAGENHVTF